jgi:hypothetical protein
MFKLMSTPRVRQTAQMSHTLCGIAGKLITSSFQLSWRIRGRFCSMAFMAPQEIVESARRRRLERATPAQAFTALRAEALLIQIVHRDFAHVIFPFPKRSLRRTMA